MAEDFNVPAGADSPPYRGIPRSGVLSSPRLSGKEPTLKSKTALVILLLCAVAAPAPGGPEEEGEKKVAPRDYANTLAILQTDMGDITLKFYYDVAPKHVENFMDLAAKGFYDGTMFHRVIPGFMIQGGDPNTKKPEDPRQPTAPAATSGRQEARVKAEFNDTPHKRGVVSMARAGTPTPRRRSSSSS